MLPYVCLFSLFVKGDVDWVDVASCVEIEGCCWCICLHLSRTEGLCFGLSVVYIWLGGLGS